MHLPEGRRPAAVLAIVVLTGLAAAALAAPRSGLDDPLLPLLAAAALLANLASARWDGSVLVSGAFVAEMLAAGLLGPLPALIVAVVAEGGAWLFARTRPLFLANNLALAGVPALGAGWAMTALSLDPRGPAFAAALALVAVGAQVLNVALLALQSAVYRGTPLSQPIAAARALVPGELIAIALTVALASMLARAGIAAAVFLLVAVAAYARMAELVAVARDRARAQAALSWGLLSGLLRTLELRDPHAARHAAAVAAFARDIAQASGMSERDCELAHTAGLLHDIGGFAPVSATGATRPSLEAGDWESVELHPVIGADLLRDLTLYGPVAEIVRAHHERPDGRGYPDGLRGEEIPELAKIVAVAEVYDTLTAAGSYRPTLSSFEALTELRRVSDTQLEGRYVEALAAVLAGRDIGYRHADDADFGVELALERRITAAAG